MTLWRGPMAPRWRGVLLGGSMTDESKRVWPRATQRLRRLDVVHAAENHVVVIDGKPVRFTYEEALRLSFLWWRLYGDTGQEPREGGEGQDG